MGSEGQIAKSVGGSIIIALLAFIALVGLAPSAVPFSTNNYGWNGLQQVASVYSIQPVSSIDGATRGGVLLIMAPTTGFSQTYAGAALNFVKSGGVLVVTDGYGTSNTLLSEMGVGITIQNYAVFDPMYNWKAPSLPIALIEPSAAHQFRFLSNVSGLALDQPGYLNVTSSAVSVLGVSSSRSYAENRSTAGSNLLQPGSSQAVARGPFPMVAAENIGRGSVVVISDSDFFTNSVWTSANNQVFAKDLFSNSIVYLDTSHWPVNTQDSLRALLDSAYAQLVTVPLRYALTLGFVLVSLLLLPTFSRISSAPARRAPKRQDITYGDEVLNRVRKDRERYGIKPE
ncbi:MAG: DUF4350 domain-containing protein [Nitrososphaerales archaeon]